MASSKSQSLQQQILDYLRESNPQARSGKALRAQFQIGKADKADFKHLLRSMVESGALERAQGRRYMLPGTVVPVSNAARRESPRREGTSKGVFKARVSKRDGEFWLKPLRRSMAAKLPGSGLVSLPKHLSGDAKSGDTVLARLIPGKEYKGHLVAELIVGLDPTGGFSEVRDDFHREHRLRDSYPKKAEQEAALFPEPVLEAYPDRLDLRATRVVTIDPATAKDHDDALSLRRDGEGNWHLGVHIADVSEYVLTGGAIDIEAAKRAFTQYLPWTAVPMLPQRLSKDLCSLLQGRDRLAFSCLMRVSPSGELLGYEFRETLVQVDHFYAYEEAQETKDKGDPFLSLLDEFTSLLRKRRFEEGLLDFQMPEARVVMSEEGEPVAVAPTQRLASHSWVEECMLLANRATAMYGTRHKLPILYRVHEQPDLTEVYELLTTQTWLMQQLPADFDLRGLHSTGGYLNPAVLQLYALLLNRPEPLPPAVQRQILQTMKKAEYSNNCSGHFALNWKHYAHFTSPIRRYPDLWTHRIMKRHLKRTKIPRNLKALAGEYGESCSEREIQVMKVERQGMRTATAWVFRSHVGKELDGVISGVEGFGLFVQVLDPYGEGLIPVRYLGDDYYELNEAGTAMVGRHRRKTFALGDKVRVLVEKSDPGRGQVDFSLVREEGESDRPRSFRRREPGKTHRKGPPPGRPSR